MREVPGSIPGAAHSPTRSRGAAAASLGIGDGAQLICHGLRRRCAPMCICSAHVAGRPATPKPLRMCTWPVSQHTGRGESGWCSDMTSTHGVWRHTGVQFLLSGAFLMLACVFGPQHVNTGSQWSVWCRTTADKTVVMCRIEAPRLLCCTFLKYGD